MFEKFLRKGKREVDPRDQYEHFVWEEDFDAASYRQMEDYYIWLGHMKEEDRMPIPPEIEFRDQLTN
jgi:hypothetical protein